MQVSWIEPDHLRDLVGRLQKPAESASLASWEIHTLPEAPPGETKNDAASLVDNDLWLADAPAPPAENRDALINKAGPPLFTETGNGLSTDAVANPNLDRIREKLQAIREKAIEAGLITKAEQAPCLPAAPEPDAAPPVVSNEPLTPAIAPAVSPSPAQPTVTVIDDASFFPDVVDDPFTSPISEVIEQCTGQPVAFREEPSPPPVVSPFSIAMPSSAPVVTTAPSSAMPRPGADILSFEVPLGTIQERLGAFSRWAEVRLGSDELLIIDDHGDVLSGRHEHEGLLVSAMMACTAALRHSAMGACDLPPVIEQRISAGRLLVIVSCQTIHGVIHITTVLGESLPASEASILRDALIAAVETPAEPQGSALD